MAEIKILNERPISLTELKEKIKEIEERDKKLNPAATKLKEYLNTFAKLKPDQEKKFKEKINALNIPRLKEKHIIKIIDIMPKDIDFLKAVINTEDLTIKQEDLKRIVECLKE